MNPDVWAVLITFAIEAYHPSMAEASQPCFENKASIANAMMRSCPSILGDGEPLL